MEFKMKRNLVIAAVAAGSILNISPSVSRARSLPPVYTGQHSDRIALAGDWVKIGKDLSKSMERYGSVKGRKKQAATA